MHLKQHIDYYSSLKLSRSFYTLCLCSVTQLIDSVQILSYSTQNRSFRRRFFQPVLWLGAEET